MGDFNVQAGTPEDEFLHEHFMVGRWCAVHVVVRTAHKYVYEKTCKHEYTYAAHA